MRCADPGGLPSAGSGPSMSVRRKFEAAASGFSYFLIEFTGFDSDLTFDSKLRSPLTGGAEILGVFGTVGVGFQF